MPPTRTRAPRKLPGACKDIHTHVRTKLCIYISRYAYVHIHTHATDTHPRSLGAPCVYTYVCPSIYGWMCIHVWMYGCVYMYACIDVHTNTYGWIYMHVCMDVIPHVHVCMHACVPTCVRMGVYTYRHTDTYPCALPLKPPSSSAIYIYINIYI